MLPLINKNDIIEVLTSEPPELNYGFYYVEIVKELPTIQLSNQQWIDFLCEQFCVNDKTAKIMLKSLIKIKENEGK